MPLARPEVGGVAGAAEEQGRILDAGGATRAGRRVDQRQGRVGIAAVPEAVPLEGELRRLEVAGDLRLVSRLQEEADLDVPELHLFEAAVEELRGRRVLRRRHVAVGGEALAVLEEARVGGPGEVVHVGLLVDVGRRAVGDSRGGRSPDRSRRRRSASAR